MMYGKETILEDLAPFADLGTNAPVVVEENGVLIARLVREGYEMDLIFSADGAVTERYNDIERRHVSFRALLASPSLSNLGRWADSQTLHLRNRVLGETLPIIGQLSGSEIEGGIDCFDEILIGENRQQIPRTSVTLVNGPAGIGKTSLIRALAYRRASEYRRTQRPLLLHVESRGRVLQNLTDLMAFSLQTLRVAITYDQIPALVRNGLVVLAIDGFDELGDPNGYDLAWAQVNDLIVSARGRGNIILAGRETFISEDRMEKALTAVDPSLDRLQIYSLCALRPAIAKEWLIESGWPERIFSLEAIAPLFEVGSYALRPFFLSELAREGVVSQIETGVIDDLFSFLIEAMIERETTKFGRDIEAATTTLQRKSFIRRLMEEVARDQAENQSDSIPLETITWLSEIVASEFVPSNLVGILKNRSGVIAFLNDDDRRGYRRFMHEQVANYFLSSVTIRAISDGETPKYIRRNIIGLEFLENFCSVFRKATREETDQFFRATATQIKSLGDGDRARRNLGALILSACSVSEPSEVPMIENVSLDDVFITESVSPIRLNSVTIGQLFAREADLRKLDFEGECFIASLIADDGTIPSPTFPVPAVISLPAHTLVTPQEKGIWLQQRLESSRPNKLRVEEISQILTEFEPFNLLGRLARYKPYWLKDGDERGARRILDDPYWELLKDLMTRHDLLVQRRDVQASGRPAPFYHVKNRKDLLNLSNPPQTVLPFLINLLNESVRIKREELKM